jgi:hypothetical protein
LPVLGVYTGAALETCEADGQSFDFCPLTGMFLGGLAGMVAATTIDAAILARPSDRPPGKPPEQMARANGTRSAPTLAVGRDGTLNVGWRGTF